MVLNDGEQSTLSNIEGVFTFNDVGSGKVITLLIYIIIDVPQVFTLWIFYL